MMMRGFLSLMMCCLLWGTAYSQITYDITGVWENGAGRTISVRTLEDGNVKGVHFEMNLSDDVMLMAGASSWIRWSWLTTERLLYAGKSTRKNVRC